MNSILPLVKLNIVAPGKVVATVLVRGPIDSDQTRIALATLKEESIREVVARHFTERQRDARDRRRLYAVEKILQGEDVNIGNGVRMVRLYALAHEHENERFWTYLEAIEIVGARLHQSLRTQVGTSDDILQRPADEYVKAFFNGVDTNKYLTAKDVAQKNKSLFLSALMTLPMASVLP